MGSEDLFKKRKARRLKDQQRRIGFCKSYDRVLIVCEGEQTEPLYFESFKQEYDLSSANVVVTDASKGSDPVSVVRYAEKLFKASQKETANLLLSLQFLVLSIGLSCTLTIPQSLSRLPLPLLPN